MKNKIFSIIQWTLALLFGVIVFFFWWKNHPELISFHEQNQMFLFTSDYFMERISVAGGLADYVSEYLVQFFFYISLGAAILGVTLIVLMFLLYKVLYIQTKGWSWVSYITAMLVTGMMWSHLMDENTLLSYPIAIILTLTAYLLCRRGGWLLQLVVSLPMFWFVGPVFLLQPAFAILDAWREKRWPQALLASILLTGVSISWIYICRTLWIAQYPWDTVLAGINYHRLTIMALEAPKAQYGLLFYLFMGLGSIWIVRGLASLMKQKHMQEEWIAISAVLISLGTHLHTVFTASYPHDQNTHVILEQTYQIRKSDWNGIIAKADEYKKEHLAALESPLSGNAVNLALAMTNQLSTRMFDFPQVGIQSLLMPNVRDNVSNVTSMEAFWQLGFINESLRYAFDSQECIPNCRKSARFTRRMIECNILNGKYDVASKYIDLLKKTLYYRKWAEEAETFLYNEDKIKGFPDWNQKLQKRLTNDFLYYYPEMTKMLGQLVLRNRENGLAYDYFMASLLLSGDPRSFVANLPPQAQNSQDPFPRGYKEYVQYMQEHASSADAITGASY